MERVLVVVYSLTGTGGRLAQLLASQQGWPVGEIVDKDPRSAEGWGVLRCGLDSLLRRHPRVSYRGPDPGDFDTVVLVAPIWMYRLAGPMRSFVAQHRKQLHDVAMLCTMASSGAMNAFREVERLIGRPLVACAAYMQHEVDDGTCTGRLLDFARWLDGAPPHAPHAEPAVAMEARA